MLEWFIQAPEWAQKLIFWSAALSGLWVSIYAMLRGVKQYGLPWQRYDDDQET
jgi:hypothetical protein